MLRQPKFGTLWLTPNKPKNTCSAAKLFRIGKLVEGKPFIPVKGHVVRIEPNYVLEYTVIDPHSVTIPDVPENYLNVVYELEEANGQTLLTVTQYGFDHVADGERRYTETYNNGEGWNPILVQIKALVEG
jgi:uncharacterized protein YndB with AHSA1/START domain